MITELILKVLGSLFSAVGAIMPDVSMPGWWSTLGGHVQFVAGKMANLGVWLPFTAAWHGLLLVITCVGVVIIIKAVRIVASFLTGGGGSAA